MALSKQLCIDDPSLSPDLARDLAAALVRLGEIAKAGSNTLRIIQETEEELPERGGRSDLAMLKALDRLGRLESHERRAASKLRKALRRL